MFVSPTPKRFITASKVVNVVFSESDICVPEVISDATSFSCAWSALRISARSVLTCPGNFSAKAAKRSTDVAICVEFETNCCTAGISTAFRLKSSVCHRSNFGSFCVTNSARSANIRV